MVTSRTGKALAGKTLRLPFSNTKAATSHGLRTSFNQWAASEGVATDLIGRCLDHKVGSQVQRAYDRTDRLEARREVIQAWGEFLSR